MNHWQFRLLQTLGQNKIYQGCKLVRYIGLSSEQAGEAKRAILQVELKREGGCKKTWSLAWESFRATRKSSSTSRTSQAWLCINMSRIYHDQIQNNQQWHNMRPFFFNSQQLTFVSLPDKACIFRALKQIMKEWCFCTKHIQISLINDRQLGHKMHLTAASKASFVWI